MGENDLSRITALAVEDDQSGIAMISTLLRRLGIHAYVDSSGADTVALAKRLDPHPDIIFLDLHLPRKNGFEILKEIRADEELKGVLVIAVTAMDPYTTIPRCQEAGFDGFIAKPLRRERFASQIRRILSGEPVWDAL